MNRLLFAFFLVPALLQAQFSEESIEGLTTEFGSEVRTNLLVENDEALGIITYFRRNSRKVMTQFFSYEPGSRISAYDKFNSWRGNKKIILLTSAGFSKSLDYPICSGLCIDDGKVISSSLDYDKDGLFFITSYLNEHGDIINVNLKDENGKMTIDDKIYYPRITPYTFVRECSAVRATVFQSQLFYHNDKAYYDWPDTEKYAQRRFFVACYKNSIRYDIIINIPFEAPLTSYVYKTYKYLNSLGYYIHSLFNLDTGWYNFYRLFCDKGDKNYTKLTDRRGHTLSMMGERDADISRASNFLVFYCE